jgi:hypothetical protein
MNFWPSALGQNADQALRETSLPRHPTAVGAAAP